MMSPENALYEYLRDMVAAANPTTTPPTTPPMGSGEEPPVPGPTPSTPLPGPLTEAAVHATRYEEIKTAKAIRIGDAAVQVGPRLGSWKEFNGEILIEIVARVDNGDHVQAREAVRSLSLEVVKALQSDPALGSRTDDTIVLGGSRGWARVKTAAYAVEVIKVVVDPHGYTGG